MNYQITVPQMHCNGCVNLVKLSLEEIFSQVEVDLDTHKARFQSEENLDGVKSKLDKVFEELKDAGYTYDDLNLI